MPRTPLPANLEHVHAAVYVYHDRFGNRLNIATASTWNDMEIGGRAHAFFSRVVAISSTEATRALSVWPVKRLIFQTKACFLESYLALPCVVWMSALAVLSGTGMQMTTLRANSLLLNALLAFTLTCKMRQIVLPQQCCLLIGLCCCCTGPM